MARIGLSNQILSHFNGLCYIRQPTMFFWQIGQGEELETHKK
jgi:hypothetical protein